MQGHVADYHNTLNQHIDVTSEYANEENGDDFVRDDKIVPVGYEDDGDYFGLPDAPDKDDVSDHRKDSNALNVTDGSFVTRAGNPILRKTMKGWHILVEWLDGSMDWNKLSNIKNAYPMQLAENAIAKRIEDEPAFKWWVRKTPRRKERIIGKVESKYWRSTHKFGIEIPKSVNEAYKIDRDTGTSHWTKAIEKEMRNIRVAFEKIDGVAEMQMKTDKVRPGYSFCSAHMIFDVKMDGSFTRKARLVADGHKTKPPTSVTYSSVVSKDSLRIALTIASLNSLEISACDIGNAYLNAPCREKLWTVAGGEFGSERGSVMIIARALYGLKSPGAAWRSTFYRYAHEELPMRGPEPLGNPVRLTAYVDANHTGNLITRRSHTGILVCMNRVPKL